MAKKLLLIDGNNLFHRAYHALPPLNDKSGENANAVFGFSNMLLKAVSEVAPDYVACAFDTAAPTFRHIEFEKYKAQRPAPPPDLYPQLPKVKKVLDAFGVPYFEKAGYEADDILATIAFKFVGPASSFLPVSARSGRKSDRRSNDQSELRAVGNPSKTATHKFEVVILSGDRDVLQLVDGKIKVQMPGWNLQATTLFGAKEVEEKYGVTPEQMVDFKSIVGDVSDNVSGIWGIGPKGAAQLLQKYKTLEGIYKNLSEIGETTRAKLEVGKDVALAAKRLVVLDARVDVDFKTADLKYNPEWDKVRAEFDELGFKSIVAKLPGGQVTDNQRAKEPKVDKEKHQLELI